MGRTGRDKRPFLKPVTKIELSEGNIKRRIIFVALFLVIAVISISFAVNKIMNPPSGWMEIQVDKTAGINSGEDFVFYYNLGQGERSVANEKKAILNEYDVLMVKAYHLFNPYEEHLDMRNVFYINNHPNEEIEVDADLYKAFEKIVKYDSRDIYLGPIYEVYSGVFFCEEEYLTKDYDPYQNEEMASFYKQLADYARDKNHVNIELLGDNRIKLMVSEEYQKLLKENSLGNYIDFSWMKNAFIADLVADNLIEKGFTKGILSSYNGFTRSFSEENSGNRFTVNSISNKVIYPAATFVYDGKKSMVTMRSYALTDKDVYDYYYMSDGTVRTAYLDTMDGKCRQATDTLTGYSTELGCVDVMMEMIPAYISEAFEENSLKQICDKGIDFMYESGNVIYYTDVNANFVDLYNQDGVRFVTAQLTK